MDPFSLFPVELSFLVLKKLSDTDLCTCAKVSKTWQKLSEDDQIWRDRCTNAWKGKLVLPPLFDEKGEVVLSTKANLSNCVQNLSMKELKQQAAFIRGVNEVALIEKSDYRNWIEKNHRLRSAPAINGKWKAAYMAELADSFRNEIEFNELTRLKWTISFKVAPLQMRGETFEGTFHPNFTWTSELGEHHWRYRDLNCVQIGEYPPLTVDRPRSNWGFVLSNHYVNITAHE